MNREFIEYLIVKRLELERKLSDSRSEALDGSDPCTSEKNTLEIDSLKARIQLIQNIENKYWSPYE